MTYNTLTDQEKERIFAVDVLGWELHIVEGNRLYDHWMKGKVFIMDTIKFHPLTNLNHAMLGMEKLIEEERAIIQLWHDHSEKWHCIFTIPPGHYQSASDTPTEAIVEACIRIKRPDLFEGE